LSTKKSEFFSSLLIRIIESQNKRKHGALLFLFRFINKLTFSYYTIDSSLEAGLPCFG
jgi:hypothetical protein